MIIETNRRRSQTWWLPSGVTKSDVLAAYQFKGAASQTASYYNLVDSSVYQLYDDYWDVSWTTDKGVFIEGNIGFGLEGFDQGYVSCAIRFSDVDVNANTSIGLTSPIDGYYLFAKTADLYSYYKTPGFSMATAASKPIYYSDTQMANGTLGYTRSLGKLYQNGQSETLTEDTWGGGVISRTASIGNATRYHSTVPLTMGTVYIQAAVFYSVALSDAQHAELAEKMNAI